MSVPEIGSVSSAVPVGPLNPAKPKEPQSPIDVARDDFSQISSVAHEGGELIEKLTTWALPTQAITKVENLGADWEIDGSGKSDEVDAKRLRD